MSVESSSATGFQTDPARLTARLLLQQLERATSAERNALYKRIVRLCEPDNILEESVSLYETQHKETFLVQAISLLESFGDRAWGPLQRLAYSGSEVCDLFAPLIASCEGIAEKERLVAMIHLTRSPHASVRDAVFDQLGEFSECGRQELCRQRGY